MKRHAWAHEHAVKTTCDRCGMRRELLPRRRVVDAAERKPIFSSDGVAWDLKAGPCVELKRKTPTEMGSVGAKAEPPIKGTMNVE